MSERLQSYLKADRVWFRSQRIGYARRMLRLSKDNKPEEDFWQSVLKANQWRPFRAQYPKSA